MMEGKTEGRIDKEKKPMEVEEKPNKKIGELVKMGDYLCFEEIGKILSRGEKRIAVKRDIIFVF